MNSEPALAPYWELPGLDRYYFENSWVLAVAADETAALLDIEAVLTEAHPDHGPPAPGEQYRYGRIALRFSGATSVEYEPSGRPPSRDASGTEDLGNIDSFVGDGAGTFVVAGGWGTLRLTGATLVIEQA